MRQIKQQFTRNKYEIKRNCLIVNRQLNLRILYYNNEVVKKKNTTDFMFKNVISCSSFFFIYLRVLKIPLKFKNAPKPQSALKCRRIKSTKKNPLCYFNSDISTITILCKRVTSFVFSF